MRLPEEELESYLEELGSLPKPERKKSGKW